MPVIPAVVAIAAEVGSAAAAVGGAVAGAVGAVGSAVGAGLGAIGAAAGVTGAGVTAGESILAGTMIVGSVGAAATSIAMAAGAGSAKPSLINPNPTPTAAQTVNNTQTSNVNNLGRAALIETSGMGVQGSDPSQRYSLLGTSSGI
jgi:hypothetical protein